MMVEENFIEMNAYILVILFTEGWTSHFNTILCIISEIWNKITTVSSITSWNKAKKRHLQNIIFSANTSVLAPVLLFFHPLLKVESYPEIDLGINAFQKHSKRIRQDHKYVRKDVKEISKFEKLISFQDSCKAIVINEKLFKIGVYNLAKFLH